MNRSYFLQMGKYMKKVLFAMLACVLLLSACGKMKTSDELIGKARKEIPIADADDTDISYAGKCRSDSYSLLWFISGDEYQAHYYLPMECLEADGGYEFKQVFKPIDCGKDIAALQWHGGYSFIINNTDCKVLRLTDSSGVRDIEVSEYPFIWYNAESPSEYVFLDESNNEIT